MTVLLLQKCRGEKGKKWFCYVNDSPYTRDTESNCATEGVEVRSETVLRVMADGATIAWLCPRCCGNPDIQRVVGEIVKEFDEVEVCLEYVEGP